MTVFVLSWLIYGLVNGLALGLNAKPGSEFISRLIIGLVGGLFVGLLVGLNRGGSAVVKHYALRLILWRKSYTPFKFIKFLDYCDKLILLKKVGGGYIFIHRMLLEYFAEMAPESNRVEAGAKASR